VCQPLPNDTASGALLAPVLPELRADVRDQILLVISEPVLSKKILALQMQVPIHMIGGGRWNLVTLREAFRDQLAPRGSLTCLRRTVASGCLGH
jgi:hypothetical protein